MFIFSDNISILYTGIYIKALYQIIENKNIKQHLLTVVPILKDHSHQRPPLYFRCTFFLKCRQSITTESDGNLCPDLGQTQIYGR